MKTLHAVLYILGWVVSTTSSYAQVGINTETPQAMLHVAGTVRIDSLKKITSDEMVPVYTDSSGTLYRSEHRSGEVSILMPYGETIYQGDAVSVGDGLTGYMAVSQTTNTGNVSLNSGSLIAQTFTTSPHATGIKAVSIFSTSGQVTFQITIHELVGGVPSDSSLGIATYTHTANSTGTFTFLFDPPVLVSPNKDYAFVVNFVKSGSIKFNTATSNPFSVGVRLQRDPPTSPWVSFPQEDLQFRIYETQTRAGYVYRSKRESPVLNPSITQSFFITTLPEFSDKLDNFIGFAKKDGGLGETHPITIGPLVYGCVGLVPGAGYRIGSTPGQIEIKNQTGSATCIGIALKASVFAIIR